MVGHIIMIIMLIVCMFAVIYHTITDKTCPYKYKFDICHACPMANKCDGELK